MINNSLYVHQTVKSSIKLIYKIYKGAQSPQLGVFSSASQSPSTQNHIVCTLLCIQLQILMAVSQKKYQMGSDFLPDMMLIHASQKLQNPLFISYYQLLVGKSPMW